MKDIFIKRPILSIVISIVIVVLGLISISGLPIQQYPDITPPMVAVSADYRGADALSVDESVATPIGQSIMGVEDLLYLQTTSSSDGSMNLQAIFEIGSNQDMSTILTQNKVSTVTSYLPTSVTQQGVTTMKTMNGFLMVYALYSNGNYDNVFLANYAMLNIKNDILKVNGVGNVNILGAGEYSMRVWVDPHKMKDYGISITEITEAIEAQSGIFPSGKLGAEPSSSPQYFTYTVLMPAQIKTPEQYGDIILRTDSKGGVLRLKDLARVDFSTVDYDMSSHFDGKPAAIMVVYQSPGSNAVDVGSKVNATLARLSKKFPDGMDYSIIVNGVNPITSGIKEILYTLLFALFLVILVIYVFIQELRTTLIPLITIPVSLIGAFMLFPLFGFSINIISLLGIILAVGLVVDDAIVVVEAVQANLELGQTPMQATMNAIKSVAAPVITTTIVLASVFVPVSFIPGVTGLMYQQFSITIALSVLISAFNALTLTPALCAIILKPKKKQETGFFGAFNRWFTRFLHRYDSTLRKIEEHRKLAMLSLVGITAIVVILAIKIPEGFLPEEDQGYLMAAISLPEAASLSRTDKVAKKVEDIILSIDDVEHCAIAGGFNLLSNTSSTSSATVFFTLKDYSQRTMTSFEIADLVNERLYLEVSEAMAFAFGPPSIPGLGASSGLTLSVQDLSGEGGERLASETFNFIDSLKNSGYFSSVTTQFNNTIPQRKLVIDNKLETLKGVSLDELHTLINTYLGGAYINEFNRFGRLYETYIQAESEFRSSDLDLGNFFIENDESEQIPISTFVTIVDTVGVEFVNQFNLYPAIGLNISLKKGVSSTTGMEKVTSIAESMFPEDITFAWSGASFLQNRQKSSIYVFLIALLFVYLTLTALYDSWVLPFSILLGIPLALLGAFSSIWLAGLFDPKYIDNVFMQISLVMLIGLSAKNAILIIEYAQMEFFEKGKSLLDAALSAAKLRIRPILMTAFAFIFGVSPLIFASGVYSTARNVMGLTLVGGVLLATLLGLFIYPSLYVIAGKIAKFDAKRESLNSIKDTPLNNTNS
ncbi:MAG: efflux RND transporter permease subunit [Rikenellaceae bacterium]